MTERAVTTDSAVTTTKATTHPTGPQPAALDDEIAAEQRYVDRVYERLEEMAASARALAEEGRSRGRLDYERGVKWDHYRALFERDAIVYHATRRLARLDAEHAGLVFGRLDTTDGEVNYIGRLGVRDEEFEPLVIDWRAPAAAVFYRATPIEPMGVIRRRVLRCRGSKVVGVEDDLLDPANAPADMRIIGDGALMGALAQARGPRMRDIVSTIQHEQDEAIRAPSRGATLITGGPGTGKTVVALHRAAYLLYSDRRRFEGGGVLVVGPSAGFMRYIERVLPSLGEQSVTLRSVGEVLDEYDATRHDAPAVAAVKGSVRMVKVLAAAARDSVATAPTSLRIFFAGRTLRLDADALRAVRKRAVGGGHNAGRADAVRGLLNALWELMADDPPAQVEREEFEADVSTRNEFTDFVAAWWPQLTPMEVLGWLADRDRLARAAGRALSADEIDSTAASFAEHAEDFSIEDVPLLDELRILLGSPPAAKAGAEDDEYREVTTAADRDAAAHARPDRAANYDEYAHILVDEAQDLSPMQWRMLGRRGSYASWTIVGDAAQSSWPDPAQTEMAMGKAIGSQARHHFRLTTNYRNSAEIFEFASDFIRQVMPDADIPEAVRSTGLLPEHRVVADPLGAVADAVDEVLSHVDGSVGVIVGERDRLKVDVDHERVSVVTPLESKGMEYDAVVVVEPGRIVAESPMGSRILYVALTRATQRLVTLSRSLDWLP
jgi:DNA helicase IV